VPVVEHNSHLVMPASVREILTKVFGYLGQCLLLVLGFNATEANKPRRDA